MIEAFSFGSMTILGKRYQKDLMIIGGSVHPDWCRREGHAVYVEDVSDILADRPEVLVVGMGDPGRMKVAEPLREALEKASIELVELPTAKAATEFNRLNGEGRRVAGAFHLTC
ncbi:MAG: Mth938-like domain-containing protein [Acidobacteriota bacterium]